MSFFKYNFEYSSNSNLLAGLKSSTEKLSNASLLDDLMIKKECFYVYPTVDLGRGGKYKLEIKIKELSKKTPFTYSITIDLGSLVFYLLLTFLVISILAYLTVGITLVAILALITAFTGVLFLNVIKNQVVERLNKYASQV
ncbi:hypothetical protein [Parvicella tangerina]|uniref:Uncharacterized protein n=1 Tax=Parvicella tangerina TaxID=2829795 RepID=A0A916JKS9_9FLAO|nr:hypothetical protein [Parvicella tangerina]CAG5078852.1 hypothetical protein CRYO30217_00787 [Parvicella tangerina]